MRFSMQDLSNRGDYPLHDFTDIVVGDFMDDSFVDFYTEERIYEAIRSPVKGTGAALGRILNRFMLNRFSVIVLVLGRRYAADYL